MSGKRGAHLHVYMCARVTRAHVRGVGAWVRTRGVLVGVWNILNSDKPPNRLRQTCGQTRYACNAKERDFPHTF